MKRHHYVVRRQEEGHALAWLGNPVLYKAIQPETSGSYAWSVGRVRPAQGPSPHIQTREDEGFYLLDGEVTFQAGNQTCKLKPGEFINIGMGTPHRFVNTGANHAHFIVLNAPAGFDAFQIAAGDPLRWIDDPCPVPTHADHARIRQLAPRFGILMDEEADWFKRTPRVHVCPLESGPVFSVVGDRYRFLATGEETPGSYTLIEAMVPPGGGPPPHYHTREHEAFHILEGQLQFEVDKKWISTAKGDFVAVPPEVHHRFRNESDQPVRLLILAAPAGIEKLFMETGQKMENASAIPTKPTLQDIERVLAAAPRYGIKILS